MMRPFCSSTRVAERQGVTHPRALTHYQTAPILGLKGSLSARPWEREPTRRGSCLRRDCSTSDKAIPYQRRVAARFVRKTTWRMRRHDQLETFMSALAAHFRHSCRRWRTASSLPLARTSSPVLGARLRDANGVRGLVHLLVPDRPLPRLEPPTDPLPNLLGLRQPGSCRNGLKSGEDFRLDHERAALLHKYSRGYGTAKPSTNRQRLP